MLEWTLLREETPRSVCENQKKIYPVDARASYTVARIVARVYVF